MPKKLKTTERSHSLGERKTQWHMAIASAMKLEFMEYSQVLQYQTEYLLNPKALQIDLLIIKKEDGAVIENDIGRIFKRHNIIEYKSPRDREGINEYFKALAYAHLYKIGKDGETFAPEDITVTMIREGKPSKLFKWLKERGCKVIKDCDGIYSIENAGFFKTQVVAARELDGASHIWLKSLTGKLGREQANELIIRSNGLIGMPETEYVEALLQIVSKANRKIFSEIKEEAGMYTAWKELFKPELDAARKEGWDEAWDEAWNEASNVAWAKNKVEAIDNVIKKLGMSKNEACALMDTTEEEYEAYKKRVTNTLGKRRNAQAAH